MKKTIIALGSLLLLQCSCSEEGASQPKYNLTVVVRYQKNPSKDTLTLISSQKDGLHLNEGDLVDENNRTMASDVRSFSIISIDSTSEK